MSEMGSRRFAPPLTTSGLPPTADITHRDRHFRKVQEPDSCTATISLHSITSSAGASSHGGTGKPSGLPAANDEPWSAVAAIVVAGASVVVVAPAGEVAGVVVIIALDIARPSDPPAASIILVADQTDLVDVGDFGGADRRRVEGRGGSGGSEQRGAECAQCDGLHGVLPSVGRDNRSL